MRKTHLILLSVFLGTLISIPMIHPAQAHINQWTWLPPYVNKVDGSYVTYKDGSTAQLKLPVYNDVAGADYGLNVSKVIISFDWGGASSNKTLNLSTSPVKLAWHQTYTFTVSFLANATEAVSSVWQHTYTIYVEHVNATGGPVGTLSRAWDYFGGLNKWKFIVYSTDQADALDLNTELESYISTYPWDEFNSIEAQQLAQQAEIHEAMGDTDYTRGEYASAESHYQTGLSLYSQAITAEKDYQTTIQDAALNTTLTTNAATMISANADMKYAEAAKTEADAALIEANAALTSANATKIQAEAALTNAYGFFFIGLGFAIGWSFIGIGVIIYALKRPKPPA